MRWAILGGSGDLVSKVTSTLIGVLSIVTLFISLVTKSHDPFSNVPSDRPPADSPPNNVL